MLEWIYDWLQSLAAYMIVAAAILHAIPGKEYEKYVRFFSGLVLILLIAAPILKLTGMEGEFQNLYRSREAQARREEMKEAEKRFQEADLFDFLTEEYQIPDERTSDNALDSEIKIDDVGEIRVGR